MMRFKNALAIVDPGACNPSGICHSLLEAMSEPGCDKRNDVAVRLMVYQLAYLCNVSCMGSDDYISCIRECKKKLKELGQKEFGAD